MPTGRPTLWTAEMNATIRWMRGHRKTAQEIANALGLHKTVVINQIGKLGLPLKFPSLPIETGIRVERNCPGSEAVPAGHPLTWGLISSGPFPGML